MLDLRWPIGLMFSFIGALLLAYGAATNSNTDMYANSLGININLKWGIVLLIFGVLMIIGAVMGKKEE
jgi:cell division protein FtsX